MAKIISKCGIDCGACPWGPYPRKSMTTQEFETYKKNVKQILGYMPIKTPCVTCQTPDTKIPKESRLPNRKCLIRQCVDKAELASCAYCSIFPCDTLNATAGAWNRESIQAKLGAPLSDVQYRLFVEPFEGLSRLEAIHASLKPEQIVEPARIPVVETKIVDFPENMPFSKEDTEALKAMHGLLRNLQRSLLGLRDVDTFGQYHKLENWKAHILRFLWILGRDGKFEKDENAHLVVDAIAYLANRGSEKTLAIWSFVRDTVFKVLSEYGVSCQRAALEGVKEEDLVTGTDYLRNKGWVIKISFEERIGGAATLKALQTYARRLDEKYGKKGFQYFKRADMLVLSNKRS